MSWQAIELVMRSADGDGVPIADAPRISAERQRLVLLALAEHANAETGISNPSAETIGREMVMPVGTVRRALGALRDAGLIEAIDSVSRGRTSTRYVLTLSSQPAHSGATVETAVETPQPAHSDATVDDSNPRTTRAQPAHIGAQPAHLGARGTMNLNQNLVCSSRESRETHEVERFAEPMPDHMRPSLARRRHDGTELELIEGAMQ